MSSAALVSVGNVLVDKKGIVELETEGHWVITHRGTGGRNRKHVLNALEVHGKMVLTLQGGLSSAIPVRKVQIMLISNEELTQQGSGFP